MNKDDMIREIAGLSGKTPYFGSYTYELDGRTFELELPGIGKKTLEAGRTKLVFDGKESDYQAVKCEDETFLAGFDGKMLLFSAVTGEACLYDGGFYGKAPEENVLIGWETEMHFAAGLDRVLTFGEKEVTISGEAFPASYAEMTEDLYAVLLETGAGPLLLALDLARFILYGGLAGSITVGGCIEVPEE